MIDPNRTTAYGPEAAPGASQSALSQATGRRTALLGVAGAAAGFSALLRGVSAKPSDGKAAKQAVDPATTYHTTVGTNPVASPAAAAADDSQDAVDAEKKHKRGKRGPTGPTGPHRKGKQGPTGPTGPGASVVPGGPTGAVQINDGGTFDGDYRLFYDYANTGYIGINTGSPYAMLDVVGSVGSDALSIFKGASNQTGPLMVFKHSSDATLFEVRSDASSNIFIGKNSGAVNVPNGPTEGINLIGLGEDALAANTIGLNNVAIGKGALKSNVSGFRNVAVGIGAMQDNTSGSANMAIGNLTLHALISGQGNTAIGDGALYNHLGDWCTAIGRNALNANTSGSNNTAVGSGAGTSLTTGNSNTAIGKEAMTGLVAGSSNTAVGKDALQAAGSYDGNTAVGTASLYSNTGGYSTAVGFNALNNATTGGGNTAVGSGALVNVTTGADNTAIGKDALGSVNTWSNASALGRNADVTGSDQVQLGDSNTTTYVYGSVSARSDIRDKTDIRDTILGLDFINRLRPVDFRWDYREDYRPAKPSSPAADASPQELAAYNSAVADWITASKFSNLVHDGSKKRTRFHHGLIAQEVQALIADTGVDFGGFQDHRINGGDDVRSIGYEEFIAPLIKAVQELSAEVAALKAAK